MFVKNNFGGKRERSCGRIARRVTFELALD